MNDNFGRNAIMHTKYYFMEIDGTKNEEVAIHIVYFYSMCEKDEDKEAAGMEALPHCSIAIDRKMLTIIDRAIVSSMPIFPKTKF